MDGALLLRRIRMAAGVSQGELAEAASVPQQAISRWERGLVSIKFDTLVELADAVGVQLHVGMQTVAPDDSLGSLIAQQLARTPEERVAHLVERVRFGERMRAAQQAEADRV